MSKETMNWLNNFVLIGDTAKRGQAWHYQASEQDGEPNHYEGSIPVEDIRRRLFDWIPETYPLSVTLPDGTVISEPNKQVIVRPEFNGLRPAIMGVPSDSYDHHDGYGPLLDFATNLIDDDLVFLSAGLLKNGAVGWVQVGLANECSVAGGDKHIPFINLTNSLNGTIANRIDTGTIRVVCDNTHAAFLKSAAATYKVKHTKYSRMRVGDARDALGLLHQVDDAFQAEVNDLLKISITNDKFTAIVDNMLGMKDDSSKAALTRSEKKRDALIGLWNKGDMVAPLDNTAYKAWQAFNTWDTHYSQLRADGEGDKSRAKSNFTNMVTGKFSSDDEALVTKIKKFALAS